MADNTSTVSTVLAKPSNAHSERQRLLSEVAAYSAAYKHQQQVLKDNAIAQAHQDAHEKLQKANQDLKAAATKSIGAFYALFQGNFAQVDYQSGHFPQHLPEQEIAASALDVHQNLRFSIQAPSFHFLVL